MRAIKLVVWLLVTALLFFGCNKDNPTEPNSDTDNSSPLGQPIPDFASGADYGGVMVTVNYFISAPVPGVPPVSASIAFAEFNDGANAGTVTVNGNTIGKLDSEGKVYYISPNPSSPTEILNLEWGGANHSWSVGGGNGVPALTGTVRSPFSFNVNEPVEDASITKSNGMQVRWSGGLGTTSRILIQIVSNSGKVKIFQDLADNGSYSIPASELSALSGDCNLSVVRYTYNDVTNGGKHYYLISEVVKSVNIKLN